MHLGCVRLGYVGNMVRRRSVRALGHVKDGLECDGFVCR
jgi:hypothetical protein